MSSSTCPHIFAKKKSRIFAEKKPRFPSTKYSETEGMIIDMAVFSPRCWLSCPSLRSERTLSGRHCGQRPPCPGRLPCRHLRTRVMITWPIWMSPTQRYDPVRGHHVVHATVLGLGLLLLYRSHVLLLRPGPNTANKVCRRLELATNLREDHKEGYG